MITGTGTQADPYTFNPAALTPQEVWADIKTILSKSYTEYGSLPAYTLDMNDVEPEISAAIPFTIGNLFGNGFSIKNLHSTADYAFSFAYRTQNIYDIHFENVYGVRLFGLAKTGGFPTDYRTRFYGITASGYFSSSDVVVGATSDKPTLLQLLVSPYSNKGCSFNVKAPNARLFHCGFRFSGLAEPTANSSLIIFEGKSLTYPGTSGSSSMDYGDRLIINNCLICGSMDKLIIESGKDNIINAAVPSLVAGSGTSMTVYNSTIATPTDGAQYLIGVTDEQLKDAAYLASIGFPIGVST